MFKKVILILAAGLLVLGGCTLKEFREYRLNQVRAKNPAWDDETVRKIAGRRVEIGMTGGMVREAMGLPDDISRKGDVEKWSYAVIETDGERSWKRYVYFVYLRNNEVVRIEGDRNELKYLYWSK